jgi:fatty acyl-CoA reductase
MKSENPGYRKKVFLIKGDCSIPGLGLSVDDHAVLVQEVNIVFHAAATIRFDEELRNAFSVNVLGVKYMLELAREMLHLKARNIPFRTTYVNSMAYLAFIIWE